MKYIFYLFFFASNAMAEGVISLAVDKNDCNLKEFGWRMKSDPIIFEGQEITGSSYKAGCEIMVPKAEFHNEFQMCAVGSITIMPNMAGSCSFDRYIENSYMFKDYSMKRLGSRDLMCNFVCYKK